MLPSCTFRFHDSLNDFLPPKKRGHWLSYAFQPSATVKDAIEAIGVPHVEVGEICVGSRSALFSYSLQKDDAIEVLPYNKLPQPEQGPVFLLDVHLGKLARLLRLLGLDTHYETAYNDAEIVALALEQNRIVLTRDIGLLKHKVLRYGYWLRSQQADEQVVEILSRYRVSNALRPFTRCLACNGFIHPVNKVEIEQHLLPDTKQVFSEFFQCNQCGKIYWKGSHYENMLRRIENFRSLAGNG